MSTTTKRQSRKDKAISLNTAIAVLAQGPEVAERVSSSTPAMTAFSVVKEILTIARVCSLPFALVNDGLKWEEQDTMATKGEYIDLGLICTNACETLNRGLSRKQPHELGKIVSEAIDQFTV